MGWPRGLYGKWSQELESESRVLIKFRGINGGGWRVLENRECVRTLDVLLGVCAGVVGRRVQYSTDPGKPLCMIR
jgi:hypothetical protein